MLSKNNSKLLDQRNANKQQRFGLRKLSIGVASVLLGTTFFLGATTDVHAATIANQGQEETTNVKSTDGNSANLRTSTTLTKQGSQASNNTNNRNDQTNTTTSETITTSDSPASQTASKSSVNNQDKVTQAINISSASKNQSTVASLLPSLRETTSGTTITDNGKTEVNLTRGNYQNNRQLVFNVYGKSGDIVTVTVPKIFTPSADQDKAHGVTVKESRNNDGSAVFTYSFTNAANRSFGLNIVLQTAIQDWDLPNAGDKYYVTVNQNGSSMARITYIIGKTNPSTGTSTGQATKEDTEIIDAIVKVDPNEHGNLVQGQKYAFGLQLPNTGNKDKDNYKGTLKIDVPDGFELDQNGAYGLTYASDFGKIDAVYPQGLQISQNGGAGTPITISFDNGKSYLNDNYILFWGTYTKNLDADNNKFIVNPFDYQTENNGELSAIKHFDGKTRDINLSVTDAERSSVKTAFNVPEKIGTDNGTANGTHQYEDVNNWKYPDGSTSISILNDGNIVQNNVKVHLDVEPGTIFTGKGINFNMTGENAGIRVIATLKDDSRIVLVDHNIQPVNSNGDSASIDKDTNAKDGSNIKSLDVVLDKIQAGSQVNITFNNGTSAILSSATNKKVGDKANYSYTINSDQLSVSQFGSKQSEIVAPDKVTFQLNLTGHSGGFINGTYDKNSISSTGLMNRGRIAYIIAHNKEDDSRPSSYFIVIPAGFHVEDATNNLRLFYKGKVLSSDRGTIRLLPERGPEGEYVYRVDLSFTPGQEGAGYPVYVQKDNNQNVPLTINDDQGPASYNYIQHQAGNNEQGHPTGVALLMEINTGNDDLKPVDGFQATSLGNEDKAFTIGGKTYSVMPESMGWHVISNNGFSDAKYTFFGPSIYGADSGVRNNASHDYQDPEHTGITEFQYGTKVPTPLMQSGQLRLSNLLTEAGNSKYSYNIINIPNGSDVDFTLSNGNITIGSSDNTSTNNSELWYSTNIFTDTAQLNHDLTDTEMENLGFVKASAVRDWSKIKSVLLKTGPLTKETIVNAYVPFKITGMRSELKTANVQLQNLFQGEHNNSNVSDNPTLNLHVIRYVSVTTKWVKKTTATTPESDIKPAVTSNPLTAGSSYSTSPLATAEIPDGYQLVETPSNANGTVNTSDIIVKYIYVKKEGPSAKVTFIDDDANAAHPAIIALPSSIMDYGKSGDEITFAGLSSDIQNLNRSFTIKGVHNDTDNKDLALSSAPDWSTLFGRFDNTANTTKNFTIHLGHKINKNNDTRKFKEIVHYKYNDAHGNHTERQAHEDKIETVTFTRTVTEDLATGQKNYSDWDKSSKNFVPITSPKILGYKPDEETVTSSVAVTDDPKALIEKTVYYTPNAQTASITFVDDSDNSNIPAPEITATGNQGDQVTFTSHYTDPKYADLNGKTPTEIISALKAKHYVLVSDNYDPAPTGTLPTYGTKPGEYVIHLKHAIEKVDTNNPHALTVDATVKRIITYHFCDNSSHSTKIPTNPITQSAEFTATGYWDKVLGKLVEVDSNGNEVLENGKPKTGDYLTWKLKSGNKSFAKEDSPVIAGYHITQAEAVKGGKTVDDQLDDNNNVKAITVDQNYGNVDVNVYYVPDGQYANLVFQDDTTGASLADWTQAQGHSNERPITFGDDGQSIINNLVAQGYQFVNVTSGNRTYSNVDHSTIGKYDFGAYDADDQTDQIFTVHLIHGIEQAPTDKQQTQKVTRTITYKYADGSQGDASKLHATYTQSVTFCGTGMIDKVTGKFVTKTNADGSIAKNADGTLAESDMATEWTPKNHDFDAVQTPEIDGYTATASSGTSHQVANNGSDVAKTTVTPTTKDINVTVTYTAEKQTAILRFVDDDENGESIKDYTVSGQSNTAINFDTDAVKSYINSSEAKHYVLQPTMSKTTQPSASAIIAALADENESIPVSDNTDWSSIFGNFDTDSNTDQVFTIHFKHDHGPVESKTVKETINYVGADKTIPNHESSITFTAKSGSYRDLVTNEDHVTGWNAESNTFAAVDNPYVPGYHVVSAVTADGKNALDDNQVKAFDGIKSDSNNIEVTVTYAKDEPVDVTTPVSDTKTVTETIHYVYGDGTKAHDDHVATITFTRNGIRHSNSGNVDWNAWTPTTGTFAEVKSPVIDGYKADTPIVNEQGDITNNSNDLVFTVTYTKNSQPTDNSGSQPTETPVEQPTTPQEPVQPTNPINPVEGNQPVQNVAEHVQGGQQVPTSVSTPVQQQDKQLPQTGSEHRSTALIGLGLVSLLGALGIGFHRKKDLR